MQFEDHVAWVTGASSGIGRAVSRELADRGMDLALSARSRDGLEETARSCGGQDTEVLPLDVTDREATAAVAEQIRDRFGRLDLAVFNAGTYGRQEEGAISSEAFERNIDVNWKGVIYGIEAALPLLREDEPGTVVGMSSASAYAPLPRASAYGSSKAAVNYMLNSLRLEWDHQGIEVDLCLVCPGFVKTPMTADNDFPMPFLMEVDEAARRIVEGLARDRAEIHFPRRLTVPLKILDLLPRWLYEPLVSWFTRPS